MGAQLCESTMRIKLANQFHSRVQGWILKPGWREGREDEHSDVGKKGGNTC
jgi:hypothetical protein